MCRQCQTSPVYEFTNKRKLCKTCFIRWFQKKFFYTIRKFKMIERGDIVQFDNKGNFRDAVLDDLSKLYSEKGSVEIVKMGLIVPPSNTLANSRLCTRINYKLVSNTKSFAHPKKSVNYKNFPIKIAISSTSDIESKEIVNTIIKGDISKLNNGAVEKDGKKVIIKPLYLFLDKEVLLYAKLRKLKFKIVKEKAGKIDLFIDDLEKKHPEVKQSVISSYVELFE